MDRPRATIRAALDRDPVVWLSSVRPDGRPHVVPVWFVRRGHTLVVLSKPGAQKVRNVRAEPRVMIAIGEPGPDFDVELVEALAELPSRSVGGLARSFGRKYADQMAQTGTTSTEFAEIYSQPIVIRPTRWLGYGGASNSALRPQESREIWPIVGLALPVVPLASTPEGPRRS